MQLPPLTDGIIIARYKRFFADVTLADGTTVTAHCPNTGAMKTCWQPGAAVQLSAADNPARKLRWTLERVDMGGGWIGVNTARTNHIIAAFIAAEKIPALAGYADIRKEPKYAAPDLPAKYANSRFDLLLQNPNRRACYVEIKNATLLTGDQLRFPDAVTTRGRKHLELLAHAATAGNRAIILFAANRPEGNSITIANDIDPAYAAALQYAQQHGVEVIAIRIQHTKTGVEMGGEVMFC